MSVNSNKRPVVPPGDQDMLEVGDDESVPFFVGVDQRVAGCSGSYHVVKQLRPESPVAVLDIPATLPVCQMDESVDIYNYS